MELIALLNLIEVTLNIVIFRHDSEDITYAPETFETLFEGCTWGIILSEDPFPENLKNCKVKCVGTSWGPDTDALRIEVY